VGGTKERKIQWSKSWEQFLKDNRKSQHRIKSHIGKKEKKVENAQNAPNFWEKQGVNFQFLRVYQKAELV